MIARPSLGVFLALISIACLSCVGLTQYKGKPAKKPLAHQIKKKEPSKAQPIKSITQPSPKATQLEPIEKTEVIPPKEQVTPPEKSKQSKQETEKLARPSEPKPMSNQELLDSALDFCQVSNDFWEQGDLDNALDALDKAYSLILRIDEGESPEVLQQKEDLRFTISKRIIEVYSSRFTVANGDYKAIPLTKNRHVDRALALFKGREKKFFLDAYRRSGKYRTDIVKSLREAGLPEELSWLPLIESGFKVRAFSRARALGLWQFIASTGYKFGLKRDYWVDERMDPDKSTQAAIAYLKELHQIFGDWTTALAAYNCGERRVLRVIRSQRINYLDNFWDLYTRLPRETAFYVPKFLAVLHILNDPHSHGIELPPVEKALDVDVVSIDKQVHLKTIAKRLTLPYDALKQLNPELRHHLTPKNPYSLKVPKGRGEILLAKLGDIPVWRPPVPDYYIHRVRRGDSLSELAKKYKTSVRAIMAANGLRRKDYLKVGWKLKIPSRKGLKSASKRPPVYTALKAKGKSLEYVVRKGDSLWEIARRYNTTTKAIKSQNRLVNSRLRIGQVLQITPARIQSGPTPTKKYKVREGDSPYLIAKRHKMNLAAFLRLNHLTPRSTIYPGQVLRISAD